MKYRNRLLLRTRRGFLALAVVTVALLGTGAAIGISQAVGRDKDTVFDESIPFDENGQVITIRDQLELTAKNHPGFGGYTIDPDDNSIVTVLLTDEKEVGAVDKARSAAESALGAGHNISEVRVGHADFLYTDLAEWFRQFRQHVWPEIVDIRTLRSIRPDLNRIYIEISDISARGRVVELLQKHGIPVNAVVIEEGKRAVTLAHDDLTEKWRPVPGGVQIQRGGVNEILCTSGFPAKRNGVQGLVINSHCTNNAKEVGGLDGMDVHQPFDPFLGTNRVAREDVDPELFTNSTWSQCDVGDMCRWSDSAFAGTRDGASFDLGHVAKPNGHFTTAVFPVDSRFRITDEGSPQINHTLEAVGYKAGWYRVKIKDTCADIANGNEVMLCQIVVTVTAGRDVVDGDSGSPVFEVSSGNDHDLMGVLWGKKPFSLDRYISNYAYIYLDLGGSWDVCVPGFGC